METREEGVGGVVGRLVALVALVVVLGVPVRAVLLTGALLLGLGFALRVAHVWRFVGAALRESGTDRAATLRALRSLLRADGSAGNRLPGEPAPPRLAVHLSVLNRELTAEDYELLLALDAPDEGAGATGQGLSKAAIAALPEHVARRDELRHGKAEEALCCPVCLEHVAAGDVLRTLPRCGHKFHVACVDAWLERKATCPLCKGEVV